MHTQNGTGHEAQDALKQQLESFKIEVSKMIDRVTASVATPGIKTFTGKVTEAIKAHPIVAVTAAFGAGYLLVRLVRQ